jgi:hypothetical protein
MSECAQSKYQCATCPIRRQAVAKPQSIFARIHRWHSGWCAGWKAYQAHLHADASQRVK